MIIPVPVRIWTEWMIPPGPSDWALVEPEAEDPSLSFDPSLNLEIKYFI